MTATNTTEAREELRKTLEGYMTDSIGAALDHLRGDDSAEQVEAAGLTGQSPRAILRDLTGVTA